ncbi:MAG TPA: TonB-dependent receptor [Bacteroidia bacterium]|jgi:vitamin B12 transporter|nr:TonB-dependent receptor [Bacteroidia bacterium]
MRHIFFMITKAIIKEVIRKKAKALFICISLLLLQSLQSSAQILITGTVTDKSATPVPYASIYIVGTSDGASSDSLGHFTFNTSVKGQHTMAVLCVGYAPDSLPIIIDSSNINLTVKLQADQTSLGEVVASAGSFEANDKVKGANMTPIDVVTTAGNNGDIANALRALPGTQQIGEQEGLFVRGGTSDETKQYVDGAVLKSPNFPSVPGLMQPAYLSPFLFKGINFSSGGYSALYGDGMSGALILESVDLPDQSSSIIGGSPIVGTVGFQQLTDSNRCSYGINTRYVNYNAYSQVIPQQPDFFKGPEYITVDGNFRIMTSNTGMLKYYVNTSYNAIGMINQAIDSAGLKSSFQSQGMNVYNILSYRDAIGENWKFDIGLTYNYSNEEYTNKLLDQNNNRLFLSSYPFNTLNNSTTVQSNFVNTKAVISRYFGHKVTLRFGGEYKYSGDNYKYADSASAITDNSYAAFVEGTFRLSSHIVANIGARYEHTSFFNRSDIAPRVSLAYRFADAGQLNLAYGIFYEEPNYGTIYNSLVQNEGVVVNTSNFLTQFKSLNYSSASHYIINYAKKANDRFFRIEAYYKQYDNLVMTYPNLNNGGTGYARGVEVFWKDKKTIKNIDYWITYTYLDTKREYLDYPSLMNPSFSTPNTASLVVKRYFEKLNTSVNLAYYFATGRPYYDIRTNFDNGQPEVYSQGTTITYNALNISIAYMASIFPKWKKHKDFSIIFFSINNALGNTQVFGYNYSYNGLNKVPITLPASRVYFIGLFINFGLNRTDDFINQNL